ncbi:hypothetical protein [Chitinophaga filiformis]|uniref:Uncharacterized protein n=1 Tax=Chitinophaga filiformis TaxID=104663 RepID=A0A1G8AAR0_CHIFI|nr:hypothetical protein [Chitinophaga filiformis]SDH18064.1 hypothetical protein SAMN04488121_109188 [Chitinophaga filiformis]
MPDITTFETLDREIERIGGKPIVLEALWAGDTGGWYLLLYIYTVKGIFFFKRTTRHLLGEVSSPEGIEYFTNGKPSVSLLAEQFGNKASEKYNLTFYFPSPKDTDEDCPAWTERHLAITCADCSKLIIPTDSPHLPKDICYDCHLTREENEKLKDDSPADGGVHMYLYKDDEYEPIGYCTNFESFPIAPFIEEKVKNRLNENAIDIVKLDRQDIIELKGKLENALDQKLDKYEIPVIDERKKRFIITHTLKYKGKEYELMRNFNDEHIRISNFIHSVETAEKAIAENYIYEFYFNKGITYRDDSFLRFIHYVCHGRTNIADISNRYTNILTDTEVLQTLKKLEQLRCVMISNDGVQITQLGQCII